MPSREPPRVILHIGGAKCGSSAIQAYLAQNTGVLRDRGVLVPGTEMDVISDVTGEQIWFFEKAAADDDPTVLQSRLSDLVKEAGAIGVSTLIISAENMCNHTNLAGALAEVLEHVETRIVFYVRRQDDFLISSWQQWNLKRFPNVEHFLAERAGKDARWFSMISPWIDAFGETRIKVRPFARPCLRNGDIIDDFFHVVGIGQEGCKPLRRNANPSFDEALARLAHRARDVFDGPHDNRFYDVMTRLMGDAALKKASASSLLDLETRRGIVTLYAEENEALKQRFMPEFGDKPLFAMPGPEDVIERSETEKLSEDIAMLTRAVYALAARTEGRAA